MDLTDLEQLVDFAALQSLGAVAQKHNVSQPSVTRTMQRLEQELGVTLFTRAKNRIGLNEVGRLAVEEARLTLAQIAQMKQSVRSLDRKLKTISIASCEVFCIAELVSRVRALFPEMTIASEIKETAPLWQGLRNGLYDLVILPYAPEGAETVAKKIGEEPLMVALPRDHRLAGERSLTFAQINGENMLLYSEIGFWKDVVFAEMPDSRFLMQNERYTFAELTRNSVLPFFTTAKAQAANPLPHDRVAVPLTDACANPTFYLVTRRENKKRFAHLFASATIE